MNSNKVQKLVWLTLMLLSCMVKVQAEMQRVLVMAESGGQHEAFTQTGLSWLHEQAKTLDFSIKEINDCMQLKAGDVAKYDLVIQLNYPP